MDSLNAGCAISSVGLPTRPRSASRIFAAARSAAVLPSRSRELKSCRTGRESFGGALGGEVVLEASAMGLGGAGRMLSARLREQVGSVLVGVV